MTRPPDHLPDNRSAEFIVESAKLADEFAKEGTVMHFAFRLGFMPYNEKDAEAIIDRCIRELEWYQCRFDG